MSSSNPANPLPYSDAVESIPPDEANDMEQVIHTIEQILQKSHQPLPDVHGKGHGCAIGTFAVLPGLPSELAQGLFRQPSSYDAAVRFSSASGELQADSKPDGRGMAIKVLGVEGPKLLEDERDAKTQDFVMVNHPAFVARNVKDYLRLEKVLLSAGHNGLMKLIGVLVAGDLDIVRHLRELGTVIAIQSHKPANVLSNTYYSMAPIRFGEYVAKYRATPAQTLPEKLARPGSEPDALRHLLEETLRQQEVLFNFQVQLRRSEQSMPIEDASVVWPESESPFQTVATFRLPIQEIAPRRTAGNNLSFTVWHAIAEHRPLGGINRIRRKAYWTSSVWRHQQARTARQEPDRIEDIL
jgi:hypothetical protein